MSKQGTVDGFEKKPRNRAGHEDNEAAGGKKRREKKPGTDEAERFLSSLQPHEEKVKTFNDSFSSISRSVEGYKTSYAELIKQLESGDNSLEEKKLFYANAMRLVDGLNNIDHALIDLKNRQLSGVEGDMHELVIAEGGIPAKADKEYDRLSRELDSLRDSIQEKIEEVEQLKRDDHDNLVAKGQEQGVTDAKGIVEQAQAEKRAEKAKAFFFEKVSAFKTEINRVRAIKAEDGIEDEVAFNPPTSWGQIASDYKDDSELLKGLEEIYARGPLEQLYSDLQVAVEKKNEELKALEKTSSEPASALDDGEEAELEEKIADAGMAIANEAGPSGQEAADLEACKRELKALEAKIKERKNSGNKPKYNRETRKQFEREAAKLRLQIAELEKSLGLGSATVAPDNSDVESALDEASAADIDTNGAEQLSADLEAQLDERLNEELERINQLPPKERAGLIEGIANAGYWMQRTKSNVLKRVTASLAKVGNKDAALNKYISEFSKTYERDAVRAEKMRVQQKGALASAAGLGVLSGNLIRLGRASYELFGGSFRSFNPFRHITAGSLFVARGAEAGKEMRLNDEQLIAKNRPMAEVDFSKKLTRKQAQALEELHDQARAMYLDSGAAEIRITGPDGKVDQAKLAEAKGLMDKAYLEHLPKDLAERLSRLDVSGVNLLEKFFLDNDVKSGIKSVSRSLEKVENNPKFSAEEKAIKKQAILASSEKLLKDMDRMIGDQGAVDWLAYAAKKTEWTGKAVANVMLVDSIRLAVQKLPELSEMIREWRVGPQSSIAGVQPAPLPPEAQEINQRLIDKLDGKPAEPGSTAERARFDNRTAPTAPEMVKDATSGHAGTAGQAESPVTAPEQTTSAGPKNPSPEQAAPARPITTERTARTVPVEHVPPAKEAAAFDRSKNFTEEAVVHKGDGVVRVLKRQIIESPEEFGFKGNIDDAAAVAKYASKTAEKVAAETGYWNRETGEEVRLSTKSIGRAAYVLERKGDGKFEVHEHFNSKSGQEWFQKEETHGSGSVFEGDKHESYEYIHKASAASRIGEGGGSRPEKLPPELQELLDQTASDKTERNELAVDPHGIESEAVKLSRERFAELASVVGKDSEGNLLIKETEIAKVVDYHDGISNDEKAKLVFWKEHAKELPTGGRAKEFFNMVDRAFADKSKIEYNSHLLKAYGQMPEDMKSLPGRAVGYLKVFGGAGYADMARDGVKDMIGLGHLKDLDFKLSMRNDGVVIAENIKLPGAARAVDVYISHDKIGMMQPNSFFGLGRWDFWKGELGVSKGQPTLEMDSKNLRQLTHNIRNIDNLNTLNERRFTAGADSYPQSEKEVKMIDNEPEEQQVAVTPGKEAVIPAEPEFTKEDREAVVPDHSGSQQIEGEHLERPKAPAKDLRLSDIQRPRLGAERLKQLDFVMKGGNISGIIKLNNNEITQYLETRGVKIGGVEQKNLAVVLERLRNARNLTGIESQHAKTLANIITIKMRDLASQNETIRTEAAEKLQQLLGGHYQESSKLFVSGARK